MKERTDRHTKKEAGTKEYKNSETLFDSITDIRDDLIGLAQRPKTHRRKKWISYTAAAAAIALIITAGSILLPFRPVVSTAAHAIANADYPQTVPYPQEDDFTGADGSFDSSRYDKACENWQKDVSTRRNLTRHYADSMDSFLEKSIRQFLSESETGNIAYSPLNVCIALGMLAELTDGTGRQQLLELLDCSDIPSLRSRIHALWNANYRNDGANTRILANSLWLSDSIRFVPSTMDTLASHYYASSFQGTMGSGALNQMLQDWLDTQTGGLLKKDTSESLLTKDTVLALATTVYFRGKWQNEFLPQQTASGIFHTPSGEKTCDFMHKEIDGTCFFGRHFSAVSQSMGESGSMWFVLPKEDVSVSDLIKDPQAMEFLVSSDRWNFESQKAARIRLSVPKFDISSQLDLSDGLQTLGITDIFDPQASDFSPMTADLDGIFLSQAEHAVRVAIDEKGCTAAAYTVMAMSGGGSQPPDNVIDFVLNRPFLFVITDAAGLPLFTGIVRQP